MSQSLSHKAEISPTGIGFLMLRGRVIPFVFSSEQPGDYTYEKRVFLIRPERIICMPS